MKYLITEEIESPNKMAKYIEVTDFFFVTAYTGGVAFAFSSLVHENLKIIYMVFSFLFAIFLTSKSSFNRKRRNYESLFLMIKHDTNIYQAVYGETRDEGEKQ